MKNYINDIINLMAYAIYKKVYKIEENKTHEIELFLSSKDNEWNRKAAILDRVIEISNDITLVESNNLNITDDNNNWNIAALKLSGIEDKDANHQQSIANN